MIEVKVGGSYDAEAQRVDCTLDATENGNGYCGGSAYYCKMNADKADIFRNYCDGFLLKNGFKLVLDGAVATFPDREKADQFADKFYDHLRKLGKQASKK